MRLHLCTVYVYTAQDVVQCCGSSASLVSSCVCFGAGALRRIHAEALLPPDPKGWISATAGTVRPISHAFLGVLQTVGCQSTRATPVDRPAVSHLRPPRARLHALLNASAAGESTTAGGLKAASLNASAASESTS